MGTVDMGADEFSDTHMLGADLFSISESAGGVVHFTLNGGSSNAGRDYLLLGSVSGTIPGTLLPGGLATLPLNWDQFTNIVIAYLGTSAFHNFMATLDGSGESSATFDTLGPFSGLAGATINFSYALNSPWNFASNTINVEVVP